MTRIRIGRIAVLVAAAAIGQALLSTSAFAGEPAVGLTDANQLVFFDTDTPGTIIRTIAVTGLQPTEGLVAIDFRPGGGTDALARQLYALSAQSRVYTINLTSGTADLVPGTSSPPAGATGTNPFTPLLASPVAGLDFNPQADRLRVLTDAEQNLRLVPLPISTFTDTALTGNGEAAAAAYTENYPAARATTLFAIDAGTDTLIRQGVAGGGNVPATDGPNGGVGTTIGSGLGFDTAGPATSLDISAGGGRAFAGLTAPPALGATTLHTIDLTTGTATAAGAIGGGRTIRGLALAPGGAIQYALRGSYAAEGEGVANVVLQRSGGDLRPATVNYVPLPASAGPADFALQAGTVAFAAGETTKTIAVAVADDALDEPAEAFLMTLITSGAGSVLGTRASTVVTIIDDDAAAPGPAPDPGKPFVLASPIVATNISSLLRSGRLRVVVSCSEECALTGTLKFGAKTIASGAAAKSTAGTLRMTLKLTRTGRALLRTQRRSRKRAALRLALRVTATDSEGDKATATSRVLLPRR